MSMFCFQCEQTVGGKCCTTAGACGKSAVTAELQDELVAHAAALASAICARGDDEAEALIIDALFVTLTNVNFDDDAIRRWIADVDAAAAKRGAGAPPIMSDTWTADPDIRSLRSLVIFGLKGMAAYAHHARVLGADLHQISPFFPAALSKAVTSTNASELLELALEVGRVNLKCMEILDAANTTAYGAPSPSKVTAVVEPGPFIIVTGHDLRDLHDLLEQSAGRGVNIYTHGEMLPAHAYPELKKYPHLKGHFGTAWQNQQREFDGVPAPVLFTTNCIMPPRESYIDRIYTASVVGFPGTKHIETAPDGKRDFSPIIERAIALGGYDAPHATPGTNGGTEYTTGFGHETVLCVADKVIAAVKEGKIKHFFLVGGCDGARPERGYFTEFVKQVPKDCVVLTLACGKFRFNDLDLGEIGGLPRLMDMGQCNDAYSAIKVATALAEAFGCGVNELPLSLVLSWYEQKAAAILLTLLAIGIKNIYLGPTLPAFVSPNILNALVEKWNVTPTSTPEADLAKILG